MKPPKNKAQKKVKCVSCEKKVGRVYLRKHPWAKARTWWCFECFKILDKSFGIHKDQ